MALAGQITWNPNEIQQASLDHLNHRTGHFQDVAGVLDADGVAIRAGHHCAQPLHRRDLHPKRQVRICLGLFQFFSRCSLRIFSNLCSYVIECNLVM